MRCPKSDEEAGCMAFNPRGGHLLGEEKGRMWSSRNWWWIPSRHRWWTCCPAVAFWILELMSMMSLQLLAATTWGLWRKSFWNLRSRVRRPRGTIASGNVVASTHWQRGWGTECQIRCWSPTPVPPGWTRKLLTCWASLRHPLCP